jgi:hypothetical protein
MRRLLFIVFAILLFSVAGWSQTHRPAHPAKRVHHSTHVKRAAYGKRGAKRAKTHHAIKQHSRRRHARRHGT